MEQQWSDNYHTAEGHILHERSHDPYLVDNRAGVLIAHAVPLRSEKHRISGVSDVVEFTPNDEGIPLSGHRGRYQPSPVEYKKGKSKIEDWDRLQVCAQALCLEEMLSIAVTEGSIFYWETRRRERVQIDEALRSKAISIIDSMHEQYALGVIPKPSRSKFCKSCSMRDICLSSVAGSKSVIRYLEGQLRISEGGLV